MFLETTFYGNNENMLAINLLLGLSTSIKSLAALGRSMAIAETFLLGNKLFHEIFHFSRTFQVHLDINLPKTFSTMYSRNMTRLPGRPIKTSHIWNFFISLFKEICHLENCKKFHQKSMGI